MDLLKTPEHTQQRIVEDIQEDLRLAYVALTRAVYLTFLFRGKHATNALSWLLIQDKEKELAPFDENDPDYALNCLAWFLKKTKNAETQEIIPYGPYEEKAFEVLPVPEKKRPLSLYRYRTDHKILTFTPFRGSIDPFWRIASYSSVSPASLSLDEWRDFVELGYDERSDAEDVDPELLNRDSQKQQSIFTLYGGAVLGDIWHNIMENLDFNADRETILDTVRKKMAYSGGNGLEEPVIGEVAEMFEDLLTLPLRTGDGTCFTLSDLEPEQKMAEFEFMFKLSGGFTGKDLKETIRDYVFEQFGMDLHLLDSWNFRASGGYMTGLMDLFFQYQGKYYVIDWKSNRLDGNAESFVPERIRQEMGKNFYFIQYLLYLLAVVRFVRFHLGRMDEQIYQEKIGGVFYIFMRGAVLGKTENCVFYDLPPYGLIMDLEKLFDPVKS